MPTLQELTYRDCAWCGVKNVAMVEQSRQLAVKDAGGQNRSWLLMACPRCAGCTLTEVIIYERNAGQPHLSKYIERQSVPAHRHERYKIDHLPEDVEGFFTDALRVLDAGVPDAAAVQLRRTLEAAAAHKGHRSGRLVQNVQKLIEEGHITRDFGDVLSHIRQVGNAGAHAVSERVDQPTAERALAFTAQFLRNMFEVPGELAALSEGTDSNAQATD